MSPSPADGDADSQPFRCERPAKGVYWRLPDGRTAPVRCGASNRCDFCAWMASVENSIVVGIDARERQPTVGMTLTTHRADFPLDRFRTATAQVFRWLRQVAGADVPYLGLMEWTTGSGGRGRMPHMHALLKDVGARELGGLVRDPRSPETRRYALEIDLRERWEKWTGGAWVVDARPLRTPGGAIAYMVGHHHKREQAPPRHLKGVKRMRPSRGYFERPVPTLREEARATMRESFRNARMLAELVEAGVPDEMRDELLDALLWEAEKAPAAELCKTRDRDGAVVRVSDGQVVEQGAASCGP